MIWRALASVPVIRSNGGLIPANERAEREFARVAQGQRVRVAIYESHSAEQRALLWALVTEVADATGYGAPERLMAEMKLDLGLVDVVREPDGSTTMAPRTIATLDTAEMTQLIELAANHLCLRFLPHERGDRLVARVNAMLAGRGR